MFDSIPISMWNSLESVSIFIEDVHQVDGVLDKKFDVIKLITSMKFGQKPSCCLFRYRRKQPEMQDFVRLRIDDTVQPVVIAVDADHFLADRDLIRTHRRNRL